MVFEKITSTEILSSLYGESSEVEKSFYREYIDDFKKIAEELSYSYKNLYQVINRHDQSSISDADFQSALLFWTALNTIMAAIKLFGLGYSKEPQMLIRNAVEIFSSAYDIHINPKKYDLLLTKSKKFNSTYSISVVKQIHPLIGQMYGMLSDNFSHVSPFHSVPHKSDTPLCVGGLYDPNEKKYNLLCLSLLVVSIDLVGSIIEYTFFNRIETHRFWSKNNKTMNFKPNMNGHGIEIADRLGRLL